MPISTHNSRPLSHLLGFVLATIIVSDRAMPAAAESPAAKNVLLVVSDDLKASVLGCYGGSYCQMMCSEGV